MVLVQKLEKGIVAIAAIIASPAVQAQIIDRTASIIDEVSDFEPVGIRLGATTLYPSAEVGLEYDSNIFAIPTQEVDDFRISIEPNAVLKYQGGSLRLTGTARAKINQYFDQTSENSVGAFAGLNANYRLSKADRFGVAMSWQRVVEDRGDPEARNLANIGPRIINRFNSELNYAHNGAKLGYSVLAGVARFDHNAAFDRERDFVSYRLSGKLSYRIAERTRVFVRPFFVERDFSLQTDNSGVNRDSRTFGANAGVEIDPGGALRGELAAGIFHFNPGDVTLQERTGLSVQGSLIYQPTERTAFFLDASRGDVATVRNGATAREDTRLRFGIQQEIRSNLRAQWSVFYRHTNFVNGGDENTVGGLAELEYRLNRAIAIAVSARYADRTSSQPSDRFERFFSGVELRLRY